MEDLISISPIDGRYRPETEEVRNCFSEFYLIKNRIIVEIEWLKFLSDIEEIKLNIGEEEKKKLNEIVVKFDLEQAKRVKEIDQITKHDVKAVEYYLDEKLNEMGMDKLCSFVHFACTSEDINNIAYGIMETELINTVYIPNVEELIKKLREKVKEYTDLAMLSHTHGQKATPTTLGKEFAIFVYRAEKILEKIKNEKFSGKFNGTVGNFNTHMIAFPQINWIEISKNFVEKFDLEYNLYTTQIESHDNLCLILSLVKLLNNIILDLDNDMWTYISKEYFKQKNIAGEIGSSVMPHKINPINFENSMANIKMANGIIDIFTQNLQVSRMQRDLSDSSLLRNLGTIIAHSIIAIKQTIKGLNRTDANKEKISEELDKNPQILAEAVQTILRKNKYKDSYEKLKELTRGKEITKNEIKEFVSNLDIESEDKEILLNLTPKQYIGLAEKLANNI